MSSVDIGGHMAHQAGHAIDGPLHQFSKSKQWKAAWDAELRCGRLSKYAAKSPAEGFAEFARLLFSVSPRHEKLQVAYPKATRFWEERDLLKKDGTGEQIVLQEIFDQAGCGTVVQIELHPPGADVAKPEQPKPWWKFW